MEMDPSDPAGLFDLYGNDAGLARARADALARRAHGLQGAGMMLRTLTGDRDPTGGALAQAGQREADQLAGAIQHGATSRLQEQHYATEQARQRAQEEYWKNLINFRGSEVGAIPDAVGNPVLYRKHGEAGVLVSPAARPAGPLIGGSGAQGGLGGLSAAALDQAAEVYHRTGTIPGITRGRHGQVIASAIATRAAELHPEADLAGNKAGYGADVGSLKKLQTQADAVNAFESTAMRNLDQFLETAKNVVDTGSPLFNMPARKFSEAVMGNPEMTQFNVARQVAVQEIGKVLSGAMGNAAISDSARHEVASLLSPDASLAQIHKAAEILRADMANRRSAYEKEIANVRSRASGRPVAPAAGPAEIPPMQVTTKAERDALPAGAKYTRPGDPTVYTKK